jgi:hypothetical protein
VSGSRGGQADGGSIAHGADGLQRHVARTLCGPFVGLLEEQGADEPDNGGFVGKDTDNIGAALDLAVETLDGVRNRYEGGGACLSGWDSFSPGVW